MKGTGIGLFVAMILIPAIIIFISLAASGYIFPSVFGENCRTNTIQTVKAWADRMKLSTAQEFSAELLLNKECVEHVEKFGIKFKDDSSKACFTKFACKACATTGDDRCTDEQLLTFKFSDSESGGVILPSDVAFKVRVIPAGSGSVEFVGR